MYISIRQFAADGTVHYFRADVSQDFAERHDTGSLVSIGWTVGGTEDTHANMPLRSFQYLQSKGFLTEVSKETWNHSGCQSTCRLRGHESCRW